MASRRMFTALAILFAGALAFALPACAQRRPGSAPAHSAHFASARHGQAAPFISARRDKFDRRGRGFYNNGLFYYPGLFPDDYDSGEAEEPLVQPIIVQPATAAQPQQLPAKTIEPLVLEDHNGQWTRVPVGSEVSVGTQASSANAVESRLPTAASGAEEISPSPTVGLPPAVLVFRDGHQEQVRNYTIQGNDLYTNADYWSTGSWKRKIPLADLDIPATLKLNTDRGTKFNLPRSPNQVVVRF